MASDTRYAYAVGRVRGLEPQLIDRALVDRLLGESPDGLLRWAKESDYASAFATVDVAAEFMHGLDRHLAETFAMLERIAPAPDLIRVFRLRYDYFNLGVLFKAHTLEVETPVALSELGTVPPDRLREIVHDQTWLWLAEPLRETWRTAEALAGRGASLRVIGAAFDQGRWRHSLAVAREHDDAQLEEFFQQVITVHNICTFLRVHDGAAPREEFDALLLDEGRLDRHFFRRHYDEPVQLFLDSLGRTDYARHMLTRGVEALPETRAYWHLNVARENYWLYYLARIGADNFGIGPLVYYLLRKKAEGTLLQLLWLAARAGWDRATVRERLRSVYA